MTGIANDCRSAAIPYPIDEQRLPRTSYGHLVVHGYTDHNHPRDQAFRCLCPSRLALI